MTGLAVATEPPPRQDAIGGDETASAIPSAGARAELLAEAVALFNAGESEDAATTYERILLETRDDPRALAGLSRTWTARDDFDQGLDLAQQALEQLVDTRRNGAAAHDTDAARTRAEARLALGEAYFRRGDLEEAGIAFRRSLAAMELAASWHGLARYELTVPHYQAAGRALRHAHALDPDNPRIVRRLASLVRTRQETLELYRHYLELPPVEGAQAYANARAWLAVLEAVGDRKLYRMEGPARAEGLPLGRIRGLPLVDVRIGDLPARPFLVDSGAGGVTVSPDVARRLNLEPIGDFTIRGVSADTLVQPFILLPSLAVGPYTFHNVPAVVITGRSELRGIVGLSLLAPLRPVLEDFRTLFLARPSAPTEDSEAARGSDAGDMPAGCPQDGWWRGRNISGMFRITARLQQQPVHLIVDTGAAQSILSRGVLLRVGLSETPGGSSVVITGMTGLARDVGRVRERASLTFFGRQTNVRGTPVLDLTQLSHSLGSEIDGILGVDLLKGFRLSFDYGAGRLGVESVQGRRRR